MSPKTFRRAIVLSAVLGIGGAAVFSSFWYGGVLTGQAVPRCGDGLIQAGVEQCDDGNTNPGDGCNAVCFIEPPPGCGNGVVAGAEQCDDWNNVAGDGCSPDCKREALTNNAQCVGITDAPSSVTAGQSFTAKVTMNNTGTKQWKKPNHYLYDVDWKNGGFTSMRWGVATAQLPRSPIDPNTDAVFSIAATAPAQAGSYTFQWAMLENGVGYFGATCTKTITVTTAASSAATTQTSPTGTSPVGGACGDLICQSNESCVNCPSDCICWLCGNGIREGSEQCDDGNTNTHDACPNCKIAMCGDTFVQTGVEECDAGVLGNMNWDDASAGCTTSCRMPACGDGVCQQQVPATGYNESCNDCPSDCGSCPNLCGNRHLDPGEECDDGNTANGDGCSATCKTEVASACRNGRDDADRDADADCADIGCIDPDSQVGSAVRCDPDGTTETDRWDEAGDTLLNFFDLPSLIRNPSVELKSDTSVSLFFRRLLGQAAPPAQNACVEAGGIVMESTFRISNNLSTVDIKKNSCAGKQVSYTFPQKISPTQDALSARGAIAQGCYSGVAGDPIGGCYGAASTWMRDVVEAAALEQEKPSLSNGRIHRIELEWCRADCVCQGAKDDATDTKKRIQDTAKAKRSDVQAQYSAMILNGSPEQIAEAAKWSQRTLADIAAKEKEDLNVLQNVMDGAAGQCFQQCMTGQHLQTACPAREPDCCSSMCISTMCPVQRPTAVTNMRYLSLCQYLAQVALPCGAQGPGGPGLTVILPESSSSSTAALPVAALPLASSVSSVIDAPPAPLPPPPDVPAEPVVSSVPSSAASVRSIPTDSSPASRRSSTSSVVASSLRQSSSRPGSSRLSSFAASIPQGSSAVAVCPADSCAAGGHAYCAAAGQRCLPTAALPCFVCVTASVSMSHASLTVAFSQPAAFSPPSSGVALPTQRSSVAPGFSAMPPLAVSSFRSAPPPLVAIRSVPMAQVLPSLLVCGDGRMGDGEECDDGNRRDFDGCSGDCLLERGACGDGVVQSLLGEQCEPAVHAPSLPYGCSASCRFVSSLCGNAVLDPGEECDRGSANSDASGAYCRTDCGLARCGDGIVDSGAEACDDGNRLGGDGCTAECHEERQAGTPLAAHVFELPRSQPATVALLPQRQVAVVPPQVTASGPASLAVMAAGAAAGLGWARRKRRSR